MKIHFACVAALAVASLCACTPSNPPMPTAPEASPPQAGAPPPLPTSLAGKWAGTITCYKIDSPLQMTIVAARPNEAAMSKGERGAVSWPAAVSINETSRLVTITSTGPADGAERVEGLLSENGGLISGAMDKQLCTDFNLRRAP
jgi:hypothetical protein